MPKIKPPATLPEALAPIWEELEGQVSARICAAGLEALCGAMYRLRDARTRIMRDGMIVADSKGNPSPHPALSIERAAAAEVQSWMSKFGRPAA